MLPLLTPWRRCSPGKRFEVDQRYPDLIEAYSCTFKAVNVVWYHPFLGYANCSTKAWIILSSNVLARQAISLSVGNRFQSELALGAALLFL